MKRFARRRARAPMQWIPFVSTLSVPIASAIQLYTLVDASAAAGAGNVPLIGRLTINRIRGEINLLNADAGIVRVSAGIIVLDATATGPSPATAVGMDAPWLWLRHWELEVTAAPGPRSNQACLPMGPTVDVKVKRLLKPNELLYLVMQSDAATTATLNHTYLRTLVSRVA